MTACAVANRMEQVRLAQADAAIDEEWVEAFAMGSNGGGRSMG